MADKTRFSMKWDCFNPDDFEDNEFCDKQRKSNAISGSPFHISNKAFIQFRAKLENINNLN